MLSADLSCRTEGVSSFVVAPGNIYIKDLLIKDKKLMHSYFSPVWEGSGTGPFGNFKSNLELKSQVGQYQNKFNN